MITVMEGYPKQIENAVGASWECVVQCGGAVAHGFGMTADESIEDAKRFMDIYMHPERFSAINRSKANEVF